MGNVTADGIWTPDEEDNLDPDVWSQQMAESITQGIGRRVARQEKFVGAFLNIANPFTLTAGEPGHTQVPLPYEVASDVCYVRDMELSNGTLKVPTSGLYSVSADFTARASSGYLEITLFKNGSRHGQQLVKADGNPYGQSLPKSATMECVAGDIIWASGCQYFGDYSNPPTLNVDFHLFSTLSVALVQAFPEAA